MTRTWEVWKSLPPDEDDPDEAEILSGEYTDFREATQARDRIKAAGFDAWIEDGDDRP